MPEEIRLVDVGLIDLPGHVRPHMIPGESIQWGRYHDAGKVAELAQDMKTIGQLQDIVVCKKDPPSHKATEGQVRYELIAGQGRLLAAKQLNWPQIRCLVREGLSEYDKARITISENDEREDLLPVDRGLSYKWAMEAGGKTQEELAADLKKTHAHVSQYIAATELSEPVREIVNRFTIGIAHINQISKLTDTAMQIAMIERIDKEGLSVKNLETLVNKALSTSGDRGQVAGGRDNLGEIKPENKKMYIKPTKSGFCATLKFNRKKDDAEQAIAFANELVKQIKEQVELAKKEEKDKGKAREANERAAQKARELQHSFDELKRMNLQNTNTEAMPEHPADEASGNPVGMLGGAQANDIINNMQQALSMPGISEADATRLKEGIQKMQEMLKATRKDR
ncbi:MAG: ParB/RepB/Spo0J family partition protein [Elusimicrobia bacterium]|nr:ParB/RepB/Spo0J family partition protein [Candidatus Liberimonas magnetica]